MIIYKHIVYIFILSNIFYLLTSKTLGSPFKNTLSTSQKKIKEEESEKRKNIFFSGLFYSFIINFTIFAQK